MAVRAEGSDEAMNSAQHFKVVLNFKFNAFSDAGTDPGHSNKSYKKCTAHCLQHDVFQNRTLIDRHSEER